MSAMRTTREELLRWLEAPEGNTLEFKEAKRNYHLDKLLKYCVALANEGGGKFVLGVTDKRPRKIVGTEVFPEPGRAEAELSRRLSHRIPVEELMLPEGRVLIVHVPSRLPGTAWHIDGSYLKRAGDDLAPMAADELRAIFAEIGPDFSAEACPGATLADLSPEAIATFRALWAKKTHDDRKSTWTDRETLANAELLIDDQITYAALILFGTHAALGRRLPQAEIVFEYRSAEAAGPAADRENFREGFLLTYDAIWHRINLRNDRQSYQDGLFRFELPTFDEKSVREALLNAVAHRDYRLGGSVFVRQYARRLEVVSPGGLPPGITPDNMLEQQSPRNRRLADALERCGLVERAGQGINLMFEKAIQQSKPLPDFHKTSAHSVWVTLEGTMGSPEFVRFLEKLGEQTLRTFSTEDYLVLDRLRRDEAIPDALKTRLPGLVALGAVESMGRGRGTRYMLSRSLYEAIGAQGVYTRKKGLDHETNKALLEKHIRDQGAAGAPMSELRQVLPAHSERAIQRLLSELRDAQKIEREGSTRWTRWIAREFIRQSKNSNA